MKIEIELGEEDVKKLVENHLKEKLNLDLIDKSCLIIEVKSKQNYKSEWETATFRARYSKCH